MSVRLGINPLSWTNDDLPTLGADTPLFECLSEGKQAGYTGFELGNKFPREPTGLREVLQEHGMDLVSGWFSGQLLSRSLEEEIEAITCHLNLLKILGSNVMVYCEVYQAIHGNRQVPLNCRPVLAADKWLSWGERLTALAKYCLDQGVRLAYHHHMGTIIETEADIDVLLGSTGDDLGLLLDTGHLTYAGGDVAAVYNQYHQRICHVHCKDVRADVLIDAKNRNLSFLDAVVNGVFTVPGDGNVDYKRLFTVLKNSDYSGWLVVEAEQDPAIAHPLTYATLGVKNLTSLCAEAGIVIAAQ